MHALLHRLADRLVEGLIHMPQAGAGNHYPLVTVVHQGFDNIRTHVGVVVHNRNHLLENSIDLRLAVHVAALVILLDRRDLLRRNHGNRDIPQGAKCGTVRRMHLAHTGALVQKIVLVGGGAEHTYGHLGDIGMRRGMTGALQIKGGI